MKSTPSYSVPALEKGLNILELLAHASEPMTQSGIAKACRRSSSEIFRMLNLLEMRRYVVRDEAAGTYRLSLRLFQLAHSHSPIEQLIQAATGPMQALSRELGESCHLSMLEGDSITVIHAQESPANVRLSIQVGGTFSPLETVSGRLLLAFRPKNHLDAWLAQSEEFGRQSHNQQSVFRRKLGAIYADGYALSRDETVSGVVDAAVPVGGESLRAALAVSALVSPAREKDPAKFLKPMLRCAKEISKMAGFLVANVESNTD
jgi:DNA-binding IclR family transcriptional regulator